MSYYDLLGVPPDASPEQIRSAYRTLVQLFHPDRLSHLKPESRTFAEERLKTLNQAYDVLSDPARRAAYDYTNAPRPTPPPPRPQASAPAEPPIKQPYTNGPDYPGAARRATLQRRQRLAQLDAEIADLSRNVDNMEAERERTNRLWRRHETRTQRWFWVFTVFTGLGALSLLFLAIGIFNQPPGVLDVLAQRIAFFLLVGLYEYASALTIVHVCRTPNTPVSYWATFKVTVRGLLAGWAVGLLGWVVWGAAFPGLNGFGSLFVIALVFLLAHVAFAYVAVGHLPRLAREQQRLFENASKPMIQSYQHQLTQLRTQRALLESEKT